MIFASFGAELACGKKVNMVRPWDSGLNEISVAVVAIYMASAGEYSDNRKKRIFCFCLLFGCPA